MKPYKFSRLRTIFITNFGAKKMNKIAAISAICCLIGIVVYFATQNHFVWLAVVPFGFPFMTFVLFRFFIGIFEKCRIKKYCKLSGITTDQFNAEYGNAE